MTRRSEIRGALAAGNKTAEQLVGLCDSAADSKAMANNLYILKKEGKVKIVGSIEGRNNYGIDDWPEKAIRGTGKRAEAAPPPQASIQETQGLGLAGRRSCSDARGTRERRSELRHPRQRHALADQARPSRGPRSGGIHAAA
jgi:hypothetical protein